MLFKSRGGTTLIDVIVSLGIMALLFGGIFLIYFSLIDSTTNIDARNSATEAIEQGVEMIRNLPYDQVGTVGGIPSGVIPQVQYIGVGNYTFSVKTTIRNIDDPYDGFLGDTPSDTAPADYKQATLEINCTNCPRFVPILFTTTISPKNLESAGSTGSLFVNVYDSSGIGVSGATVHVINSNVLPTIDLTDTTNLNGILQLVGVPTSTRSYQATVSKPGFSNDQTYPLGGLGNPNPNNPDATVDSGVVASITLFIDRVSKLSIYTSDQYCRPSPNQSFSLQGEKLIGQSPDVLKFSTTTVTDSLGQKIFSDLEWDKYAITYNGSQDLLGTNLISPFILPASSTLTFRFTLSTSSPNSLLLIPIDNVSGEAIFQGVANISKAGIFETNSAGHFIYTDTDWSNNNYSSQSGGMDADSLPGSLRLLTNASSTYPTSTINWLISSTIDFGTSTASYFALNWNPATQPAQAGPASAQFQLAANNDNTTWNFYGPGGPGTYYTSTSTIINLDNNRYLRYKVFLLTADEFTTPRVDDVSIEFASGCTPANQIFFRGLSAGTYDVLISAPNYADATTTVSIGSGWQSTNIPMVHL